ncbi:hypothetical protein HPB51_009920 [Rhipicephalus microplus]|uniref:Uncharacterized protein n=1 Tax=Rhipicephalus microplus TaxID=6941 RepID=A0A9J6ET62_RHIMP|nr:hypothetical protein HPB51_009920 [Rhipicephalus microplus]
MNEKPNAEAQQLRRRHFELADSGNSGAIGGDRCGHGGGAVGDGSWSGLNGHGGWSSVVDSDCRSSVMDCYCGWGCGNRWSRDGDLARVGWTSDTKTSKTVPEAKTCAERGDGSRNGSRAVGNCWCLVHSYGCRSGSDGWSGKADGGAAHCNGRGGVMNNSGCRGSCECGSCGDRVAETEAGAKGGNWSGHGGTAVGDGWSMLHGDGSRCGSNGWRSSGECMTKSEAGSKGSNWCRDGSGTVGDSWSMVDGDSSWSSSDGRSMVDGNGCWSGGDGRGGKAHSRTADCDSWRSCGKGVTEAESGTKGGDWSGDCSGRGRGEKALGKAEAQACGPSVRRYWGDESRSCGDRRSVVHDSSGWGGLLDEGGSRCSSHGWRCMVDGDPTDFAVKSRASAAVQETAIGDGEHSQEY